MTHPTRTPTHWRSRAVCRGTNPDLFFPEPSAPRSQTTEAKAVCARCPVRDTCLDEALTRIPDGILGGLTAQERRRLVRHRGVVVRPITAFDLPDGARTRAEAADAGRALIAAGRSIESVARICGVSARTVYRWRASRRSDGRVAS